MAFFRKRFSILRLIDKPIQLYDYYFVRNFRKYIWNILNPCVAFCTKWIDVHPVFSTLYYHLTFTKIQKIISITYVRNSTAHGKLVERMQLEIGKQG